MSLLDEQRDGKTVSMTTATVIVEKKMSLHITFDPSQTEAVARLKNNQAVIVVGEISGAVMTNMCGGEFDTARPWSDLSFMLVNCRLK